MKRDYSNNPGSPPEVIRKKGLFTWRDIERIIRTGDPLPPVNYNSTVDELVQWGSVVVCFVALSKMIAEGYPLSTAQIFKMQDFLSLMDRANPTKYRSWTKKVLPAVKRIYDKAFIDLLASKFKLLAEILP